MLLLAALILLTLVSTASMIAIFGYDEDHGHESANDVYLRITRD